MGFGGKGKKGGGKRFSFFNRDRPPLPATVGPTPTYPEDADMDLEYQASEEEFDALGRRIGTGPVRYASFDPVTGEEEPLHDLDEKMLDLYDDVNPYTSATRNLYFYRSKAERRVLRAEIARREAEQKEIWSGIEGGPPPNAAVRPGLTSGKHGNEGFALLGRFKGDHGIRGDVGLGGAPARPSKNNFLQTLGEDDRAIELATRQIADKRAAAKKATGSRRFYLDLRAATSHTETDLMLSEEFFPRELLEERLSSKKKVEEKVEEEQDVVEKEEESEESEEEDKEDVDSEGVVSEDDDFGVDDYLADFVDADANDFGEVEESGGGDGYE